MVAEVCLQTHPTESYVAGSKFMEIRSLLSSVEEDSSDIRDQVERLELWELGGSWEKGRMGCWAVGKIGKWEVKQLQGG